GFAGRSRSEALQDFQRTPDVALLPRVLGRVDLGPVGGAVGERFLALCPCALLVRGCALADGVGLGGGGTIAVGLGFAFCPGRRVAFASQLGVVPDAAADQSRCRKDADDGERRQGRPATRPFDGSLHATDRTGGDRLAVQEPCQVVGQRRRGRIT